MRPMRLRTCSIALSAAAVFLFALSAGAATFNVNTTGDSTFIRTGGGIAVLPAGERGGREVVFIDNSLANLQTLVNDMGPGLEVQLIDGDADGLAQMARWARSHRGYDAIHVVSHGSPGQLVLGAGALDAARLHRSEVLAALAAIGRSLTSGGDLLLYGCRVAEGERGRAFVRKLAAATGARVAASTDPTGAARLGGDWTLEYATAALSARPLADPAYDALLASGTITFNTVDSTFFGADGMVTDGEGGSTDIADIVIEVAAINGSNVILTGNYLAYHSADWTVPAIVTWDDGGPGTHGMVIKSSDGADFKFTSFNFYDWGSWDGATWIVEGLEGGDSVATATLTGNQTDSYVSVNLDATFQNVDEVRIYREDGTGGWIGVNNIVIADAVTLPTTTVTGAGLSADTGYSNTDWITYTALQAVIGTLSANLVAGEKVEVSYDNGTTWSDATSAVGSNTWSAATTLSGSNVFRARVYNAGAAGTAYTHAYVLDQTAPTVASVTRQTPAAAVTNADTLVFQVTFGEALANLRNASTGDFAVSGTTAIATSVNTADVDSYDVTISGGNLASLNGTVTLSFSGGQNIVDFAGNALNTTVTGTNNNTYTLDNTGPTITTIVRQTPASSPTNANSVVFRVTFGETVSNVTTADFAASGTTATATNVSAVAGDTYDVTLSGGNLASLDGTVSLDLAGGQDIADALGNVLTDTTPTGANESYTLDNTAPGACVGALSVAEGAADGTAVGTVTASDAHAVSYTLTDAAGGRFAVSAAGAVTVSDGSLLDYEAATSHIITIRATDAVGNISDTIRSVTITNVNEVPSVPSLSSPSSASEVLSTSPTLTVNASTDPDGDSLVYIYEVYSDSGMTQLAASAAGQGRSWTVTPALADNTRHWWRCRASDGTASSGWMSTANFFVNTANDAPTTPGISSPANNGHVASLSPVLRVTNASDADNDTRTYEFAVYVNSNNTGTVANTTGVAQGGSGTTSWTIAAVLSDNTTYYWSARARDQHGLAGAYANAAFRVNMSNDSPSAPILISPADGAEATGTAPLLTAANATDADNDSLLYTFEIDRLNTFDSPDKQTSSPLAEGSGTTSWTPAALTDNTSWYWRVKAADGMTDGPWMTPASFFVNTANDAPTTPTLLNPADNSDVTVLSPTLSLNAAADADNDSLTYEFRVYSDSGLTTFVTGAGGTGTSWVITPALSDNTAYYWTARATDQHGLAGAWMTARFFVNYNGINDPPSITLIRPQAAEPAVSGNSFLITWADSDPDSNAGITLGYDSIGSGCTGTQIAANISEDDPTNSHAWSVAAIPAGSYYVYALISDGVTTNCVYAAGPINRMPVTGDITNDGIVDIADALRALRIAAGFAAAASGDLTRGDVAPIVGGNPQPDGKIDIGDVVVILRKAVGLLEW